MNILNTFGPVWDAAGLRGFFGEGYWFHRMVPFWLSFRGSTLVTKTVTSERTPGNMPLRWDYTPEELFPQCVYHDWKSGVTINAVGLSGPGVEKLVKFGEWARITDPFFISWMPVGKTFEEKCTEAHTFVRELKRILEFLPTRQLGIQFNVSCPNVGANYGALLEEAEALLDILGTLGLPIVVKLNLLMKPEAARTIAQHPACSGICISNTLPFGTLFDEAWWKERFPNGSPLEQRDEKFGKGGLSAPFLLPYVRDWVHHFRRIDPDTYVNAGGGIWRASDVDSLKAAGANSIFIGTVAMHRPWRVPGIIRRAHEVFGA